jgi:hypothetical protein
MAPQTNDPARETAPKISKLEPPAVPPRETAPRVPEFKPPNVSTRETAPKDSELEPPTIPLAAFEATSLVSLLLYTRPEALMYSGLYIEALGNAARALFIHPFKYRNIKSFMSCLKKNIRIIKFNARANESIGSISKLSKPG